MILLLICLLAGVLTILAPCVLPLLPVIIGGSLGGAPSNRRRPYIIAGSLAVSIIGFTLLLKVSTILIGVSPTVLNYISGSIIIALGIVSVLPRLWEELVVHFNWQAGSQRLLGSSEHYANPYLGPVLIGLALGPVFSSCSPTYAFILASVLPRSFGSGIVYLIAYSVALVVTLLVLSVIGRKAIAKQRWAVDLQSPFRRSIGILFIIIGVVIISGNQVKVETWIGNHLPFDETRIERFLLASQTTHIAKSVAPQAGSVLNVQSTPAPALAGLTNWINSEPLTIAGLRGKVILVDFWTYSCVNCNRALPYVEKWYQTYAHDGFTVIGVHTPEFAFEHLPANVEAAVKSDGITYPVALDNNYDTWNAFDNDSWPADYLIDQAGNLRYVSIGEGGYPTTEEAIQQLLNIHQPLVTPSSNVPVTQNQSPETYFGTNRTEDYQGNPELIDSTTTYSPSTTLATNGWTLSGVWNESGEYLTSSGSSDTLSYRAEARDIYVVAGLSGTTPKTITVSYTANQAGSFTSDDPNGNLVVSSDKLYHLLHLASFGDTHITLHVPSGVQLYTFTFGS